MSEARPTSSQIMRKSAPRPSQPSPTAAPRTPGPTITRSRFDEEARSDEIRLNLSDLPRIPETMEVEAFKPTLLSRLFNLVAPL